MPRRSTPFAMLLLLACFALLSFYTLPSHAAHLQFSMKAGWASTPLGLEAGEFFTDAAQYFEFVSRYNTRVTTVSGAGGYPTDQQQYDAALSVASELLGPTSASLSVLRAALSLRSLSPAVETLRHVRANRVARQVALIPFDHEGAQELKDASEAEWMECEALLAVAGRLTCGVEAASFGFSALASDPPADGDDASEPEDEAVHPFDHVWPESSLDASASTVVLYADPARAEFARAHQAILARMERQKLRYVLRPTQSALTRARAGSAAPLQVQGFGVELALKNMEYKVLDDSSGTMQVAEDDQASRANNAALPEEERLAAEQASLGESGGFLFDVLLERRPELAGKLRTLRDILLAEEEGGGASTSDAAGKDGSSGNANGASGGSNSAEKKVAVWELKDLGFQAAQRVLQSQRPLEMLRDLSQNFPMYAQALTRTRINSTLKASVEKSMASPSANARTAAMQQLPQPGLNALEINGALIDLGAHGDELDYFSLLSSTLLAEARSMDALSAQARLSPGGVRAVLANPDTKMLSRAEQAGGDAQHHHQQQQGEAPSPFLLHVGLDDPSVQRIVTYLNDIERDARYKPWPPSLTEYLQPSWPGQLKYVRRNAYTALALLDPSGGRGLEFMSQAQFFVKQNAPIRIAVTFFVPTTAAAHAAATGRGAKKQQHADKLSWNSDVMGMRAEDSPYASLVSKVEDASGTDVEDIVAVSPHSAAFDSPQARVAGVYFFLRHCFETALSSSSKKSSRSQAESKGLEAAQDLLQQLHDAEPRRQSAVTVAQLEAIYRRIAKKHSLPAAAKGMSVKDIMEQPHVREMVQLCADYAVQRGLAPAAGFDADAEGDEQELSPYFIVNGVVHVSSPGKSFRDVLMGAVMPEQHRTALRVYHGEISDKTKDIHAVVQSGPNVMPRMNKAVLATVGSMKFLPAMPPLSVPGSGRDELALLPPVYLRVPDPDGDRSPRVALVSMTLVSDWSSSRGLALVSAALDYLARAGGADQPEVRLELLFSPLDAQAAPAGRDVLVAMNLASGILHSSPSLSRTRQFELLRELVFLVRYFRVDASNAKSKLLLRDALEAFVASHQEELGHLDLEGPLDDSKVHEGRGLNPTYPRGFLREVAKINPGSNVLWINGRVIELDGDDDDDAAGADAFTPDQFAADLRLAALFHARNFPLAELAEAMFGNSTTPREAQELFVPEVAVALGAGVSHAQRSEFESDVLLRVQAVLLQRTLAANAAKEGGGGGGYGDRREASIVFPSPVGGATLRFPSSTPSGSLFVVRALVDPLSKTAQKLSAVLLALRDQFDADTTLWLTPKAGITELPIKRFFRYALAAAAAPTTTATTAAGAGATGQLSFDANGAVRPYAGTTFSLRTRHILSTVVHTPESWLIRLSRATPDLDNLNVAELGAEHVELVQYELESLLLFGQSLDVAAANMEPPAGLQLMLSSPAAPWLGDTVVMQNLGYFQLKAPGPGEWTVAIADARHAEIYELLPEGQQLHSAVGKGRARDGAKRGTRLLFIRSFTEGFKRLDVRRKPGQERAQLLDTSILQRNKGGARKAAQAATDAARKAKGAVEGAVAGMWNSVFGGGDSDEAEEASASLVPSSLGLGVFDARDPVLLPRSGDTIHVFSLASGHLYERFLKIMMLSVLRSTRNPVKFWFLANFASPQFRDVVPRMARALKFEAEFVTYKWPLWLRRQEEKQRIIWGYKILFLDVLFPLAVKRVIYIDADQVVRGDLLELAEMDLGGAPYAYTPFCLPPHNNPLTEGFRFWSSGYWKDHLRGKPYHISALYVVDLETFRAMRAGDALRGIYDQLSADPNSLANLDQDLPNYAQHMVAIHSLPQEWLFCETWCAKEFLPKAKTIDLCNNPLTKTPKLEVAKQLLPEWTGLDEKAKALEAAIVRADAAAAASKATPVH